MFNYKLKVLAMHFTISLVFMLISAFVVYYVWYPAPLYRATGVSNIFLLVLVIGLIIGPLLSFIVSKPKKKSLRFDISVIIVLQLAGFIYGFYQVYDGRPAWIVYNVDRFDLVRNNEIDNRKLAEAPLTYRKVSSSGVRYIAAMIPKGNSEISNQILFDEVGYGIAPSQRPELYVPLEQIEKNIIDRSIALSELEKYNDKVRVNDILSAYPDADSFLPLKANAIHMTVLISKKNKEQVLGIVDLRPW